MNGNKWDVRSVHRSFERERGEAAVSPRASSGTSSGCASASADAAVSTPRAAQRRPNGVMVRDRRANVVGASLSPSPGRTSSPNPDSSPKRFFFPENARASDSVGAGSTPLARHQVFTEEVFSPSRVPMNASASAAAWRFGSATPAPTAAATVTPAETAASRDNAEPCKTR